MPAKHEPNAQLGEMRTAFMNQAGELWDKHQEKFSAIMEQAEERAVKVNFAATLDFTESKACLETTISYSQVFKDKRREEFDDPSQPTLPGTETNMDATPDAYKAREKASGKKGKDAVDVEAEREE